MQFGGSTWLALWQGKRSLCNMIGQASISPFSQVFGQALGQNPRFVYLFLETPGNPARTQQPVVPIKSPSNSVFDRNKHCLFISWTEFDGDLMGNGSGAG
jgi:hypothetical protein